MMHIQLLKTINAMQQYDYIHKTLLDLTVNDTLDDF